MGNESAEYLPLVEDPSVLDDKPYRTSKPSVIGALLCRKVSVREKLLFLAIFLQGITLAVLFSTCSPHFAPTYRCPQGDALLIYSPAEVALEYEVKSFTAGRKHKTIYQGASPEVDKAWGRLYNHTVMKIPRSEAVLLPNKTYPIKDEPGYYVAGLDVFHQLHCLNAVRRAVYRDYYVNDTDLDEDHISHCVDSIRQSLMCSADISTNVWQWSAERSVVFGHSTQAHSCRNFEKLREWAQARRMRKWI